MHYLFPKDPTRNFLKHNPEGWSYLRGYCAGMRWGKADLEENRALILGAGSVPGGAWDEETGLRTWSLDCTADHGMHGIADGYNRIVRLWVRLNGPPPFSRKRWESMLLHLSEYFDKRSQTNPPETFMVDGPPILASDGVTKVFLKSRPQDKYWITWETKIKSPFWSPLSNNYPIVFSTWPLRPREGVLLYYPGPPGSDLLLLRGQAGRTKDVMTAAFDMRYGFFLIYEPPSPPYVLKVPTRKITPETAMRETENSITFVISRFLPGKILLPVCLPFFLLRDGRIW